MDEPIAWAIVGTAGVVVGSAVMAFAMRLRGRERHRELEAQVARSDDALRSRERSHAEEREVRSVILSSMEEGILLLDPHGSRVFANDQLGRHLGAVPDVLEAVMPLELQKAVRRASYTGAVSRVELETGAPSRWITGTAIPVGDDGSVLVVVRDVTDTRRLDAVRRDFVANASHELKTPVASILAAAETLREGALDDPPAAIRFTEQLEGEALRLSRIVSDLLDLSRLETGSQRDDRVRLDEIVAEELARLAPEAERRGVGLALVADGVPPIQGSARDLALLARNLIANAIRYTPQGGEVDVTVTVRDDRLVLRVADTGIGIPGRDVSRIFERFYRVDRGRSRETGGTGLGLSIVRHVVENHDGDISVETELGQGSTFEVRLPVEESDAATLP